MVKLPKEHIASIDENASFSYGDSVKQEKLELCRKTDLFQCRNCTNDQQKHCVSYGQRRA